MSSYLIFVRFNLNAIYSSGIITGAKSSSTSTSSGSETRQLVDVPNKLRSSKESFQRAMTNPLPREFFVDVM